MTDFVKKPCKQCPFRKDVRPFLHPRRAEEIAYASGNQYNTFPCHKTLESDDEGDSIVTAKSQHCAGFLTMQAQYHGEGYHEENGFKPDYEGVYEDPAEMVEAYTEEWDELHA